MRISKYLLICCLTCLALTFTSCNNKNTPIHDLQELSEDLKQNSKNYTDDDWAAISQSLDNINNEIDEHRTEYTDEEMKEIGRLKGICGAYLTKYAMKNASRQLKDLIQQFGGAVQGVKDALDSDPSLLNIDTDDASDIDTDD